MSTLNNSLLLGADAGGYQISRSLRFNSADSAFLSRTPASAGNRKTWTWSGWVKRSGLNSLQCLFSSGTTANASDVVILQFSDAAGNAADTLNLFSYPVSVTTTQVFRDTSAWYHIVWAFDTTQTTASNRSRLYVNGVEVTNLSGTYPAQNTDYGVNASGVLHNIGRYTYDGARYLNGYLADIHFIDGQALTPSSFTEVSATTGQLIPKQYTGSFGTNGFWLKFSDNSAATATTLGKDYSGNSNNWTPNNLSVTAGAGNDSLVDTPTSYGTDTGAGGEVRGNYATLNPLQSSATLSNGNLDCSTTSTSWQANVGTVFQSSGKWYAEFTVSSIGAGGIHIGIVGPNYLVAAGNYIGNTATSYAYRADGTKFNNATQTSYGASYTTNDVIGVAMDLDAGTLVFYKNGVSQGTAYSGMTGAKAFAVSVGSTTGTHSVVFNAGQRPFAYTAPSGFKALCDTNLPAPVVAKPNTVMDVALWSGTGATQSITFQSGLSPDFVWIKARNAVANHVAFDVIRGANKAIYPSLTNAENTYTATLTSFNSSGFTLGYDDWSGVNQSGRTYVAWAWDAGSSTVTNTQGSITSQVRANASAGFSIVAWTPQSGSGTVGHGLNVAPEFIITKDRDAASEWFTYHKSLGAQNYLVLNLTNGITSNSTVFSTIPTSTVFDQGTGFTSGNGYGRQICYCFAPVAGYSSFGSYTGNGSANGPFVFTGFRPRWILIKNIGEATNWWLWDTARNTRNFMDAVLYPDLSSAEFTDSSVFGLDALSNGFKMRNSNTFVNGSAKTYIYAAFAESPFQYARAR